MDYKKQRSVYANDEVWQKLRKKANEFYKGKGAIEKYIEDISNNPVIILKKPSVHIEVKIN